MKPILSWAWSGCRAGLFAAFAAGIGLHIAVILSYGHLFVSAGDYLIPPLLYASYLTVILGGFGMAAGLFWGVVYARGDSKAGPGRRNALCAAIDRAQRRSKSLRRAVLEGAFRGELVPQDPADEPADRLLARIRAERASAPPARRRRTTSGT